MPKYNFVLMPLDHPGEFLQFISYASKLSYRVNEIDKYRLRPGLIPHVTLCQFDANESDIPHLWEQLQLKQPSSMQLTFGTVRNTSNAGLNWFSLIPDQIPELHQMHQQALTIIKDPKSISGKDYDPHLTLLNSREIKENASLKLDASLSATFALAITERDDVGQATKLVRLKDVRLAEEKSHCCIIL